MRVTVAAGVGRRGEDGLVLRIVQCVVQPGRHPDGIAERRVRGDVLDPVAVYVDLAVVPQALDVLGAGQGTGLRPRRRLAGRDILMIGHRTSALFLVAQLLHESVAVEHSVRGDARRSPRSSARPEDRPCRAEYRSAPVDAADLNCGSRAVQRLLSECAPPGAPPALRCRTEGPRSRPNSARHKTAGVVSVGLMEQLHARRGPAGRTGRAGVVVARTTTTTTTGRRRSAQCGRVSTSPPPCRLPGDPYGRATAAGADSAPPVT